MIILGTKYKDYERTDGQTDVCEECLHQILHDEAISFFFFFFL